MTQTESKAHSNDMNLFPNLPSGPQAAASIANGEFEIAKEQSEKAGQIILRTIARGLRSVDIGPVVPAVIEARRPSITL